ncbi:MAG: sulfurtransferase [Hydrogenovibrio sp.]|nr:sulfurtransferase [Hydrogenovibrio sp.]
MLKRLLSFSLLGLLLVSLSSFAKTETPVFVSAKWAHDHQDKVKFVDLSRQYQKFHIPNAIFVNYGWLLKPKSRMEMSGGADYMVKVLSQLGIHNDDYVVIYDDMGDLESSRLYWELTKLGHKKVSMLDGGSVAWILNGYPMTQKVNPLKPTQYQKPKTDFEAKYTATKDDVLKAIKDPNTHLIDARSEEEYIGNKKQKRSGHIPTAVLFPWQISVDGKHQYKQRNGQQLAKFFKDLKIDNKQTHLILYCNTGHRAARLFTMFKSQGYDHIKLYDGSMQEWVQRIDLPVKQGKNP